jgi:ABC-type cobalamin transport system ATPase subunit
MRRSRRARPEALRRREAARRHRAHPAQEPADPDLRRGHLGARLATEQAIQAELDRIAEGRTTLVIAHRLSTVMDADEILVLDAGRVLERGTHAQLLAAQGRYARMWQLQQQERAAQGVSPV